MANFKNHNKRKSSNGTSLEMAHFIDAGANKIKKRIRDLERLLSRKRETLPDTIIVEKERTLEALKLELENAKMRSKIKHNAKKYHMVRFFERKKALRRYKKAFEDFKKSNGDESCAKDLLTKKIDLCYVVNFPKTEKYIALYPASGENADSDGFKKTEIRRKAFRDLVAKQLKEGSLPVSLEDILSGKKLNKEGEGISLQDTEAEEYAGKSADTNNTSETDDFFE